MHVLSVATALKPGFAWCMNYFISGYAAIADARLGMSMYAYRRSWHVHHCDKSAPSHDQIPAACPLQPLQLKLFRSHSVQKAWQNLQVAICTSLGLQRTEIGESYVLIKQENVEMQGLYLRPCLAVLLQRREPSYM